MIRTHQRKIRQTMLNLSVAAVAFTSLGVAVAAAPYVISAKQHVARTDIGALKPLATGPVIMLAKAGSGPDEDCVRVTRMTAPDGSIVPTNSFVCH